MNLYAYFERRARDGAGHPGPWCYAPAPSPAARRDRADTFEDGRPRPLHLDLAWSTTLWTLLRDVVQEDTQGCLAPLDEPRGLPEDASDELRREAAFSGPATLGHSWFTLAELLACGWERLRYVGYLDPGDLAEWLERGETGNPRAWKYSLPDEANTVSAEELRSLLDADPELARSGSGSAARVYCPVEWEGPLAYDFFVSATVQQLHRLGAPEDVRVVFWSGW